MKKISAGNKIEKWFSLILLVLFLIFMILSLDFFSEEIIFFLFIFYIAWMEITFYQVLISNDRLILKNSILFRENVFEKKDFDFFEKQNFSFSVHRICFKNGKKFYFNIFGSGNSIILPLGFTKKKDANIICWEKWINEMQD